MMVFLDPSSEAMAAELATSLNESLTGRTIQVQQLYTEHYKFGDISQEMNEATSLMFVRVTIRRAPMCSRL